jgi:predicted RNase H-like nuclease (RuvC/YqgF family)
MNQVMTALVAAHNTAAPVIEHIAKIETIKGYLTSERVKIIQFTEELEKCRDKIPAMEADILSANDPKKVEAKRRTLRETQVDAENLVSWISVLQVTVSKLNRELTEAKANYNAAVQRDVVVPVFKEFDAAFKSKLVELELFIKEWEAGFSHFRTSYGGESYPRLSGLSPVIARAIGC